jgi:DNA-damage-inducible protein D
MNSDLIRQLHQQFEGIVRIEQEGLEFWLARDLMPALGYLRWENFAQVIDRAKEACANSGYEVADHFRDVTKMVPLGSGAEREIEDIALTRYACYLVAQNGDPRKEPVAFAQTYFAVQTRKQEIIEQRLAETERLAARRKLTISEKELSQIIYERCADEKSFGRIRSKGDRALFGGKTTAEMKLRLKVPENRPLADFLPTITIKAKDFANEITNFNIQKAGLNTEDQITSEHVKNNSDVRGLLADRGIVPEQLPPAEDVKRVQRRLESETKKLPSQKKARKPAGSQDS